MSEKQKPILTIRGRETFLSIWLSGNNMKLSVSRRTENGFEKIDSYAIPLDYLLFKALEKSREVLKHYCEFVGALEEVEEREE